MLQFYFENPLSTSASQKFCGKTSTENDISQNTSNRLFSNFITLVVFVFRSSSICCIKLWNKNEDQSAKDNSHLSKPNCRLSYPGYAARVTDGKWKKHTKRLTLNWAFPREEEYLIEINGVSNVPETFGSFSEIEGSRDGEADKTIGGAWGEKSGNVQGRFFFSFGNVLSPYVQCMNLWGEIN